jgi:hypothetical protein
MATARITVYPNTRFTSSHERSGATLDGMLRAHHAVSATSRPTAVQAVRGAAARTPASAAHRATAPSATRAVPACSHTASRTNSEPSANAA